MFNSDDSPDLETRRLPLAERSMAVTPLDVRQAKFATVIRGFDRQEVTRFLVDAAEGYDQALRENERLRQDIARLEGSLSQYRDLEGSLKNTLLSAQKLADDMGKHAAQEATRLVREAEGRAELVVEKSHAKLDDVQREIDGLKMKRREAETAIEATISALTHTLAFVREHEQRDRQDNLFVHRPRLDSPVAAEALKTA